MTMPTSGRAPILLFLLLLLSSVPGGAVGAQAGGEPPAPRFGVVPSVGMFVSSYPSGTTVGYGMQVVFHAARRIALEGGVVGHYDGTRHRVTVETADLAAPLGGEGLGSGLQALAGVRHGNSRNAWSAGLRLGGGPSADLLGSTEGSRVLPLKIRLEVRGGVLAGASPEERGDRWFGLLHVGLALPLPRGA